MPASPTNPEIESVTYPGHADEFESVVRRRRSIRKFTPQPIAEEDMRYVLDMALLAPNSSNLQPCELYWVRSPEKKKRLVEACRSQSAARTAQELVVCVARWDRWNDTRKEYLAWLEAQEGIPSPVMLYYRRLSQALYDLGPLGVLGLGRKVGATVTGLFRPVPRAPVSREDMRVWAVKSAALACENLMLAATAKGFDTCPMEGMDPVRVAKIVGVEGDGFDIPMVLALGYRQPKAVWARQWRRDREKLVHEI